MADARRQLGLGVKAVEGILDARLAPMVDWTAFSTLETLGIDEVALLKGHGHDVAVIWARDADGHNMCWRCCRTDGGRRCGLSWRRSRTL